jgi:hypothetical protein
VARQDPVDSFGGLSSQDARNPGGRWWFSEVADNFAGEEGWMISRVGFWGGYASPPGEEGNTEGFTIRFYTDDGGRPGTRLFEQDVSVFNETLYYVHPSLNFAGYSYFVDLSAGFAVPAPGQYWVSVVAILARGGGADEPQWGWVQALGFNAPSAHQWFFQPGNFQPQGFDVSFTLAASTEPSCPCDFNNDDVLNSQDFFDFVNCFLSPESCPPGAADFNGDGMENSQDFFDFLACFSQGCP